MARNRNWSDEETLMAFALYLMLPAKYHDDKNPDVIRLADAIGRTPNSVALKLGNIAAHDERRTSMGKKGLPHSSKKDAEIWVKFDKRGDALLKEAIELLDLHVGHDPKGKQGEELHYYLDEPPEGKSRLVIATTRVNQQYFRNTLLSNYSSHCCLTGISAPQLLVASHIKPWADSDPKTERLDPCNGLLLNALHDKAFDKGLITIDDSLRIRVSPAVKRDRANELWLWSFDGMEIHRPLHHSPAKEYIEYHNDVIFQKGKKKAG